MQNSTVKTGLATSAQGQKTDFTLRPHLVTVVPNEAQEIVTVL
jgi:hypothetical protein